MPELLNGVLQPPSTSRGPEKQLVLSLLLVALAPDVRMGDHGLIMTLVLCSLLLVGTGLNNADMLPNP